MEMAGMKKKGGDLYGDCPQVSERPLTKISNDTSKDRGRERLREVGRVAYHSDFLAITVVGLFFFLPCNQDSACGGGGVAEERGQAQTAGKSDELPGGSGQ